MPNVWKVAPGRSAGFWDECRENKCISINWLNGIDFSRYKNKQEVEQALIDNNEGSWNGASSIWSFVRDIRKGDIVIANKGLSIVVGIGTIISDYLPPGHRDNPKERGQFHDHVRLVDWQVELPVKFSKRLFNQPTVQKLAQDKIEAIKRTFLKKHGRLTRVLDKLFPIRLSEEEADDGVPSYTPDDHDLRKTVERQIKQRRGQKSFRDALKVRYSNRCAITGCEVSDVLEAAHIHPYLGTKDNHVENGLLLRADIHTLFDLNLMGINPDGLKIELHPKLEKIKDYSGLVGRSLHCANGCQPSPKALKRRYKQFTDSVAHSQ